jgi:hypothetical protein
MAFMYSAVVNMTHYVRRRRCNRRIVKMLRRKWFYAQYFCCFLKSLTGYKIDNVANFQNSKHKRKEKKHAEE